MSPFISRILFFVGACTFLITGLPASDVAAEELPNQVTAEQMAQIHPLQRAPLRSIRDEVYLAQVALRAVQDQTVLAEKALDVAEGNVQNLQSKGAHSADVRIAQGYVKLAKDRLEVVEIQSSLLAAELTIRQAELELGWVQLLARQGDVIPEAPFGVQLSKAEITYDRLNRRATRVLKRAETVDFGVASR